MKILTKEKAETLLCHRCLASNRQVKLNGQNGMLYVEWTSCCTSKCMAWCDLKDNYGYCSDLGRPENYDSELKEKAPIQIHQDNEIKNLYAALKGLLSDIEALISDSKGVAGLHLNGDVALWDEITDSGRFRWIQLNPARKALAKFVGQEREET